MSDTHKIIHFLSWKSSGRERANEERNWEIQTNTWKIYEQDGQKDWCQTERR